MDRDTRAKLGALIWGLKQLSSVPAAQDKVRGRYKKIVKVQRAHQATMMKRTSFYNQQFTREPYGWDHVQLPQTPLAE